MKDSVVQVDLSAARGPACARAADIAYIEPEDKRMFN